MCRKSSKHGNRPAWVNMELLTELKHEKEVHRRWKPGEAMWEEYNPCMEERSEESQSSAGVETSEGGEGQHERFLACCQGSQIPEPASRVCGREAVPTVKEDRVKNHLSQLDVHESMGPGRMHPRVLKELGNVIAKLLPIIFKQPWQLGKVPSDWKRQTSHTSSRRARRRIQDTEGDGTANPRNHFQAHEGQESHQREVMLYQLDKLDNEMTGPVDEGRAVDSVYMDFSKAFDVISHIRVS
ncbi:hypothetical protein QYF61_022666 [Mycteria americana]|uniref:Uncharacterized protein n=1 Tax=Mycteria americana TaxID=33587 RepID=A0AAN7NP93_MYCAM|nr:hypothetical protein QYF61_022666 [Mycteria americana]